MSIIQAVLFNVQKFNKKTASDWLKIHDIKPMKQVHITDRFLRYRINPPHGKMRIKNIAKGIKIIFIIDE